MKINGLVLGLCSGGFWAIFLVLLGLVLQGTGTLNDSILALKLAFIATTITESASLFWLIVYLRRELKGFIGQYKTLFIRQGWLFLVCPLGSVLYVSALALTSAQNVATVTATYPLVTLALSHIFLHQRIRLIEKLAIVIAVLGLAMTSLPFISLSPKDTLGLFVSLLCAIAWGSEAVLCAKYQPEQTPVKVVLLFKYLCSICVLIPASGLLFALSPGELSEHATLIHPSWLGLLAIFGLVSYGAYYGAIHQLGPIRALTLNVTYICWVFVFGLTLGDSITWPSFVGAILVFIALLLANRTSVQS